METILLIDDEKPIVRMEQRMLERLGYRVTAYTESIAALDAVKANPDWFDLVFTDMTMPQMTGLVLAKEIKKVRPDIPIVLCSGLSYQIDHATRQELGNIEVVMKPISKNEIAAIIGKVLNHPKET